MIYPIAVAVAVMQAVGVIPDSVGRWLMWIAPIGVVIEWIAEHVWSVRYNARRQVVLSAIASLGLGVALGRHARQPFEGAAVAPMITYVVVCLVAWYGGQLRRANAPESTWSAEFDQAELERLQRLARLIDIDIDPAGSIARENDAARRVKWSVVERGDEVDEFLDGAHERGVEVSEV